MAKNQKILTAFNAGEFTPRLTSRVDLQKYYSACETLENFTVLPQGGATRRPGLRYVAETKDSSKAARLIPFEFSSADAYILEFGDLYMRVYKNGAQVQVAGAAYEISTPYTETQLSALQFRQSADVMYIVHGSHQQRKLSRLADDRWVMAAVNYRPTPSYEKDTDLNTVCTPAATTGSAITFTSVDAVFLASDVGRQIVYNASRGIVVGYTDTSNVTVDIIDDWVSTDPMEAGSWVMTGTPQTTLTPSIATPVGQKVTLTLTAAGWRSADVGKYIKISSGIIKITGFTSTTVVVGQIMSPLTTAAAVTAGLWTLNVSSWSATEGYPSAIEFHEQCLMYANTTLQPNTIWKSVSGDFENFAEGTADDDAAAYTLLGQNEIRWMLSSTDLVVGTIGEEKVLGTTNQEPLSPSNAKVITNTDDGSAAINAVKVSGKILFVQRAGRKVKEYTYVFEEDSFKTIDLTRLAEHVTQGSVTAISYEREPDSILWCVRGDGTLLGLTYLRDEDVIAWHRHVTGATGLFESVATIPISNRDQTWVIVKRTINSTTKRYVEYFDSEAWNGATKFDQWDQLNTDCALKYSGTSTTAITGLDHLEGETVDVVVDGAAHAQKTVTSGSITLDIAGTEVEVGLHYDSTGLTMRPEIPVQGGTIQGKITGWAEIRARFVNTLGGEINGEQVYFRTPEDLIGQEPPLFTGEKIVLNLGYQDFGRITFKQEQPFPYTILSLYGELEVE